MPLVLNLAEKKAILNFMSVTLPSGPKEDEENLSYSSSVSTTVRFDGNGDPEALPTPAVFKTE